MVNQIYDSVEINQYITVKFIIIFYRLIGWSSHKIKIFEDLEWIALLGINKDNDGYIDICFYEKEYKDQFFD